MDFGTLTENQITAVVRLGEPSFIMAGAGTGKTYTLSKKIAYQMTEPTPPLEPEHLMAITFTEAAAAELRDRVRREAEAAGAADASRIEAAWISTIHSMCRRLLSENALDAGIDPGLVVLTQAQADAMMESAVDDAVSDSDPEAVSEAVSQVGGYSKLRGVVADVLAVASRVPGGAAALDFGPLEHFFSPDETVPIIELLKDALAVYMDAASRKSGKTADILEGDCTKISRAIQEMEQGDFSCGLTLTSRVKEVVEVKDRLNAAISAFTARRAVDGTLDSIATLRGICIRSEENFQSRLRDSNRLTFDALLSQSYSLLEDDSLSLAYSERFDTIMVDEFQDTDALQFAIVGRLCSDDAGLGKLTAVGDRQQSIYSFRGADLQVSDDAQDMMEAAMADGQATIPLDMNFRSNPDILAFVGDVFSKNAFFGSDFLELVPGEANSSFSVEDGKPAVELYAAICGKGFGSGSVSVALEVEARHIAARFRELHDIHDISYDSMALLLRSFTNVQSYIDAFNAAGIPSAITGGRRFYSFSEIRAALDFLRVLDDPLQDDVLFRLMTGEMFSVSDGDAARAKGLYNAVNPAGCDGKLPLYQVIGENLGAVPDSIAAAWKLISEAREAMGNEPLSRVFDAAVDSCGWRASAAMEPTTAFGKLANISKFSDKLSEFDTAYGLDHKSIFAEIFAAADAASGFNGRDNAETPGRIIGSGGDGCVSIMTIHASKGLEFDVTAISRAESNAPGETVVSASRPTGDGRIMELGIDLSRVPLAGFEEEDNYMGFLARLKSSHARNDEAESARLLYVALTRAKKKLIWTGTINITATGKPGASGKLFRSALDSAFGDRWDEAGIIGGGVIPTWGSETFTWVEALDVPETLPPVPGTMTVLRATPHPFSPADFPGERPQSGSKPISFSRGYSDRAISRDARSLLGITRDGGRYPDGGEGRGKAKEFGTAFHEAVRRALLRWEMPQAAEIRSLARQANADDKDVAALIALCGSFWDEAAPEFGKLAQSGTLYPEYPMGFKAGGFYFSGILDLLHVSGRHAIVFDYKTGLAGFSDEAVLSHYGYQALLYAAGVLASDVADEVEVVFLLVENGSRRVRAPKWTREDLPSILESLTDGARSGGTEE